MDLIYSQAKDFPEEFKQDAQNAAFDFFQSLFCLIDFQNEQINE